MAIFNGRDWTVADMLPFKYVENWDGFFDDLIEEMDARRNGLGASLVATSSTSDVAIGTGTKTLTVASPSTKGFVAGMYVVVADASNSANAMTGRVTSYDTTTGALVISVPTGGTTGSGTPSSWVIGIGGQPGATGPAGAAGAGPVWYGTSAGTANAQTLSGSLSVLTGNPSVEWVAGATNASVTRTNLLPYSKQLDNGTWGKLGNTVTADASVWIDGQSVMDKIAETAVSGQHGAYYVSVSGLSASTTYTASIYVKAAERTKGRLMFLDSSFADGVYATFDLSAGTVSAFTLGAGSNAAAAIDALPGGIYRVSISGRMNNSRTTGGLYLNSRDASGNDNYTGVSGYGFYAVGAQLEAGAVATPLITTAATSSSVADGHMTLAVGSTSAKPLLDYAGNALLIGAVAYGSKYVATYDGAYWRLSGGSGSGAVSLPVTSLSSTYTVSSSDAGKLFDCTSTFTATLVSAAAVSNGFAVYFLNSGAGTITVAPPSGTISGQASITLAPGEWLIAIATGSTWKGMKNSTASTVGPFWSSTDKDTSLVVSESGRKLGATGTSQYGSGRGTTAITDKRYFEVEVVSVTTPSTGPGIGVSVGSVSLAAGARYYDNALGFAYSKSGNKASGGSSTAFGSSYTAGDIISVAVDVAAGKIWFAKNGVWQASGDPASGTNAAFSFAAGTPMYPAGYLDGNSVDNSVRFRWPTIYAAPAGFGIVGV
ncbi:phage head spike fiber domain-containing protein [Azospirillum lipoferum]|uniref:B30.2/SPRY domain-containing protein n=1 Tax=Azospirillum lipoferum (strain 4B) TaxID=862719 RepID=G7Z7R1_AZOL4|nr:SPRY domain-containing protein [Azospirillum lipoferum]CBS87025.1 protein of unknown function [Azospirillum lipoferum 4B]